MLHVHDAQRFNDLKRRLAAVSSRVLTDKLRHLEKNGLVARRRSEDRTVYALTARGALVARHLHPIVFYLNYEQALK